MQSLEVNFAPSHLRLDAQMGYQPQMRLDAFKTPLHRRPDPILPPIGSLKKSTSAENLMIGALSP
jgi:hypothetical protein